MLQPRSTPIFRDPSTEPFDFTDQQDRASNRFDRNLQQAERGVVRATEYKRQDEAINRAILTKMQDQFTETLGQAYYTHQQDINDRIIFLRDKYSEPSDLTDPSVYSKRLTEFNRDMAEIHAMNAKSNQSIQEIKAERENLKDNPEFNQEILARKHYDILMNPFSNLNTVSEDLKKARKEAHIPAVALKNLAAPFDEEKHEVTIDVRKSDGSWDMQTYVMPTYVVAKKDKDGITRFAANMDHPLMSWDTLSKAETYIDTVKEKFNDPKYVSAFEKAYASDSTDEMMKKIIANDLVTMAARKSDRSIKEASELDLLNAEEKRRKVDREIGMVDVPFKAHLNEIVKGDPVAAKSYIRTGGVDYLPIGQIRSRIVELKQQAEQGITIDDKTGQEREMTEPEKAKLGRKIAALEEYKMRDSNKPVSGVYLVDTDSEEGVDINPVPSLNPNEMTEDEFVKTIKPLITSFREGSKGDTKFYSAMNNYDFERGAREYYRNLKGASQQETGEDNNDPLGIF